MNTRRFIALLSFFSCQLGCGQPATRAECEEIFRRSAEIELRKRNITDPQQIATRVKEARAARGGSVNNCVGKRITKSAMQCVRKASDSDALDRCLE
jgi:hypothetical protein